MLVLLDTDVIVELLRARNESLISRVEAQLPECAISAVTLAELRFGAAKSSDPIRNGEQLNLLLTLLHVLDLTENDATHAGEIRAELERAGTPIGAHDTLIAGQARARGLMLVTGNTREFARVAGIRTENWMSNSRS